MVDPDKDRAIAGDAPDNMHTPWAQIRCAGGPPGRQAMPRGLSAVRCQRLQSEPDGSRPDFPEDIPGHARLCLRFLSLGYLTNPVVQDV